MPVLNHKLERKLQTNWQFAAWQWLFSPALSKPNGSAVLHLLKKNMKKLRKKANIVIFLVILVLAIAFYSCL